MWIKICGITNTEDAEIVAQSGADAIGLNFYAPSKRFVTAGIASDIRKQLGNRVELVGVFVNSTAEEVARVANLVSLNTVQFHGDESVEAIVRFHKLAEHIAIIRAFRVAPDAFPEVDRAILELADAGVPLKAVLVDAYKPGEYGGTGHQIAPELVRDWFAGSIAEGKAESARPPIILAGGLTPENVAASARIANQWGVDTASGVETSPGRKSELKTRLFVQEARAAVD